MLFEAGCGGEGSYRLHVVYPDDAVRQAVERLSIWALEAQGAECGKLIEGVQDPRDGVEKALVVLERPFESGSELRKVEAGPTVFFAEGLGLG
ncbi:MAG: hypothetical protein DRI34_01740, partial [Deltaproteobacteria bacterium]